MLSAWNNGSRNANGSGYGLRVPKNQKALFAGLQKVDIVLPDNTTVPNINITQGFWNSCSELRSKAIGQYFHKTGQALWAKWVPPKFNMVFIARNKIKIF